ncbi:hypothetical protein [Flavobacterium sp.]|uniref:hypothetical protein n=1 Tax=Flavobacterium sp. TaxID=239 RepID=UPI002B4AC9FB|nr:hypothetical protein [Flavobacterium sp.]HLF51522.1 hypothetical protein [Flavobacterium sp.]
MALWRKNLGAYKVKIYCMIYIFRGKDGKIKSPFDNLRGIFSVRVGKRTFKTRKQIKKYVLKIRKEKSKKIKFDVDEMKYETQLTRLQGLGYHHKFNTKVSWFEIGTAETFIKMFKDFYNFVRNNYKKELKKALSVKFGVTLTDSETNEAVSEFTNFQLIVFKDLVLEDLFGNVQELIDRILELSQRYNVVNLSIAILTIMFLVGGKL